MSSKTTNARFEPQTVPLFLVMRTNPNLRTALHAFCYESQSTPDSDINSNAECKWYQETLTRNGGMRIPMWQLLSLTCICSRLFLPLGVRESASPRRWQASSLREPHSAETRPRPALRRVGSPWGENRWARWPGAPRPRPPRPPPPPTRVAAPRAASLGAAGEHLPLAEPRRGEAATLPRRRATRQWAGGLGLALNLKT